MKRSRQARGFTLTEVMMATLLLVVFFAVSGEFVSDRRFCRWAGRARMFCDHASRAGLRDGPFAALMRGMRSP